MSVNGIEEFIELLYHQCRSECVRIVIQRIIMFPVDPNAVAGAFRRIAEPWCSLV